MADQLVRTPLWKHQQEEITRLQERPRVLIGWQMGSGKTLGAIERDLRLRMLKDGELGNWRTLVVAPLATHSRWAETIEHECPGAAVRVINPKNRDAFLETRMSGGSHYYIMHYEALRLMPELRRQFHHAIFDECHRLKNRTTKQTKAAKKLQITYLTDMSGSPVTDRPADFWSILNHLFPKTFSSYWKFFDKFVEYEIVYPGGHKKATGPKPAWKKEGLPSISQAYSRVLKADVMPDLPPKIWDHTYVDLSPTQRSLYNQMRDEAIAWVKNQSDDLEPLVATAAIAKLQRLQQFALGTMSFDETTEKYKMGLPSTKIERILDVLEDNDSEQFVIWSQFKGPLYLLEYALKKKGIATGLYTGDQPNKVREATRKKFAKGDLQVFIGSIKAGGEGIDELQTHCSEMIFLDRDWSPARNEQAEDRLHRGGQKKNVNILDVMARDTVDFERSVTIERKKAWVLEMLGDT